MTINRLNDLPPSLDYIYQLFIDPLAPEEQILSKLNQQEAVMQLSPIEARLLQLLVAMSGAKNIVEIGVLAGYSAISMARILPEGGCIHALEKDHKHIETAKENAQICGVVDKIQFYQGEALNLLPNLVEKGPFDLVFIDADKANYPAYLQWAITNLRKGGIIIGDNTFFFGHAYKSSCPEGVSKQGYEGIREFNQQLADTEHFLSILIPTIEGMTVAIKK